MAPAVLMATVVVCGLMPASGESRTAAPRPVFYTNADNAYFTVKVGQTVHVSYCNPKPLPGRDCGGPFVKSQLDPYLSNNTGGGPWLFKIHSGFLPAGLVLHSNGLLTGTVSRINRLTRPWPFTICVTEFGHTASSSTKGRCDTATINVETKQKPTPPPPPPPPPPPTPQPTPFVGTWAGTLIATVTWTTQSGHFTDNLNLSVNGGIEPIFDVVTLVLNPTSGVNGSYINFGGEQNDVDPEMPDSGLVTLSLFGHTQDAAGNLTYIGDVVNGAWSCTFPEQFTQNTATTVGTIRCNGSDYSGTAITTFIGTLTLHRTGP
jgi:hypothetical protein